jgi:hypothetical protein
MVMFTLYRLLLAVAFVLCAIGNVNADPSVFAINRTYKPSGPLQGGGSGGGAFGPTIYRPKGISLLGYQTLVMSGVHRTTALTVTDGPWGLIGVWTKCSPDSTGSYSCNLAEIGNTRANWATCSTACSS